MTKVKMLFIPSVVIAFAIGSSAFAEETKKKEESAPSSQGAPATQIINGITQLDVNKPLDDASLEQERQKLVQLQLQLAKQAAETSLVDGKRKDELSKLENEAKEARILAEIASSKTRLAEQINLLQQEQQTALKLAREARASLPEQQNADESSFDIATGRLVIGNRKISLNGPISNPVTAEYIEERIQFFNNKDSKKPIYIVIDDSPGGSVAAGFRILQAMKSSKAPVYVVVKTFAASMAACITTLAQKSFLLPNAQILHHQLSAGTNGNRTEIKEFDREMDKWWSRLAEPVARKMGITLEEFVKQMYVASSTGDWTEFAHKAVELKWADHVVSSFEDTDVLQMSAAPSESIWDLALEKAISINDLDQRGRLIVHLPRSLVPNDPIYISGSSSIHYAFDGAPMTLNMVKREIEARKARDR